MSCLVVLLPTPAPATPYGGVLPFELTEGDLEKAKQLFNLFKAYFPTKIFLKVLKKEKDFFTFLHDSKIIWFLALTRKLFIIHVRKGRGGGGGGRLQCLILKQCACVNKKIIFWWDHLFFQGQKLEISA
jgi:hypothetical protein